MKTDRISIAHGDGGELAHQLVQRVFVDSFGHSDYARFDAAVVNAPGSNLAVTTDSFVVKPVFFPGGNIGKLAVAGTVNDLAVSGAKPFYLTASFIIEEGFLMKDLEEIVHAMAEEAKKAQVRIVAGDTKVVEKGSMDGLYINTTGVGFIGEQTVHPEAIREGDSIIINGTIGDHGAAILGSRGDLGIQTSVQSDCAPLNGLIESVLAETEGVRIMRDPTRGGLATALVEIAEDFHISMEIEQGKLPIKEEVRGACDILGFDPLYLANEGKVVMIVAKEEVEKVLSLLRNHELGKDARVIGRVTETKTKGKLHLRTELGSARRLNRLSGMMLPRIC